MSPTNDRLKLVVNPSSGQERALERLPLINERLRAAFGEVDISLTVGGGDAERMAEAAVDDGYGFVVAAGGDGTLNEVVNGVVRHRHGLERTVLGVLPFGTGNDFARALGLPEEAEEAAERIAARRTRAVDLGVLNDRLFVNTSAAGFIAETSDRVGSEFKTLAGRFAYLIGGAQVLLEFEPVPLRARIDGRPDVEFEIQTLVVSNSPFIGGGHPVAPDAVIDDGLLDLCVIHAMPAIEFVALLRRLSQGEHVGDELVTYAQAATLEFEADRPLKVNTDGEPMEQTRLRYSVRPGAATFLY